MYMFFGSCSYRHVGRTPSPPGKGLGVNQSATDTKITELDIARLVY